MFRQILKYSYFSLCISVFFAVEQKVFGIKLETPLEWIIPFFNIALMVYLWKNRSFFYINKVYTIVFSILAIAVLASVLNSEAKEHSLKGAVVWLSYLFAFAGGFWVLNFNKKERQQLLVYCGSAYGILLLYSFLRYLIIGINYHNSYKMALPFANGHTLLIAMAFPLWIYLMDTYIRSPKQNKYLILFLVFYTAVIYLSYSRFYWFITTLMASIVFLYYYPKWIKPVFILSIILSVTAYFAYVKISEYRDKRQIWSDPKDHTSLFVQIESIFVLSKNESNTERANRWKAAKLMFLQNITTGTGINTFPERYYVYRDKLPQEQIADTTRKDDYMNAHNLYIGTMAEQGVLGLVGIFSFIGMWIFHWKKMPFTARLIFMHYLLLGIIEDFTLLIDIIPCFWVCIAWGMRNLQNTP